MITWNHDEVIDLAPLARKLTAMTTLAPVSGAEPGRTPAVIVWCGRGGLAQALGLGLLSRDGRHARRDRPPLMPASPGTS